MKKVAAIAAIIVMMLAVLGAWYSLNSRAAFSGTPEPITIGVPMMADSSTIIFIADAQHFFADNGLNVSIKVYDAGLFAVDDILNGRNDLAVATEFVIVDKALKQEKLYSIGSIAKYQIHYLIGRKDKGIGNISDLRGKRIGYAKGTSGEFYLTRFLEIHGIDISDVALIDIKPSNYAEAIENGTVDAILVWDPYTDDIKKRLGSNMISWPAQSGQLGYWNVICRDDWAANHPELISRFLKSIDQAEIYATNHPEESKAIIQKQRNYDDTYIATTWSNTQFYLSLDQSLIIAMEDEARWMIYNNLTDMKTSPDFRNYIYTKGLEEIEPESVNIW